MRTTTIDILKFEELTDTAKEVAREWYRNAGAGETWWESTYDDVKQIGALMGLEIEDIFFSGFSSQGDGALFVGTYGYKKGGVQAVKAYAGTDTTLHGIAETWQAIQARNFYKVEGSVRQSGQYSHSGCTDIDVMRNGSYDVSPDLEREVKECLRSFMDWIYSELEKDWDNQNSDDNVSDNIVINGYEFTADGKFYE